jgi:site-specific DNA recombinase
MTIGTTVNCAVYTRISQDREGAGLGVERQEEDCRALAERLGWRVVATYADNDFSAFSGKRRPGYEKLLADLEAGRVDGVVAWHTDRLHRRTAELERYMEICQAHNIPTHTVKAGQLDLASSTGRMVAKILGSIAQQSSEQSAERIARAYQQRLRARKWNAPRAYGWTGDGTSLVPAEAALIREAAESVLAGVPLYLVTRDLNERGVPIAEPGRIRQNGNANHGRWLPTVLRTMLLRPRNAGLLAYKGEVLGPGNWPAILSEETWRAVAAKLTDSTRKTSPGTAPRWLGSGLYRCGLCGAELRVVKNGRQPAGPGRRSAYPGHFAYVCWGQRHNSVKAEWLDHYMVRTVLERLSRRDAADLLEKSPAGPDTGKLHIEAVTLRQRLTDMSNAFADGRITMAQLQAGSERARANLEAIEAKMAAAARIDPVAQLLGVEDARAVWDSLSLGRQRAVLDSLMSVTLGPGRKGAKTFDESRVVITWRRAPA